MDYNAGFSSIPAPIVKIKLTNPWKSNSENWIGLLDTGSDMSVIPKSLKSKLELIPYTTTNVEGVLSEEDDGGKDDVKSEREVALIDVELLDFELSFEQLPVILSEVGVIVIGRDILNRLNVTFSGPELTFDIN